MRTLKALKVLAAPLLLAVAGCGTGITTYGPRYVQVGSPVNVRAEVKLKAGQTASGQLWYKNLDMTTYQTMPMAAFSNGAKLSAQIPADLATPGQIRYYMDITKGPKVISMRSAARPYVVPVRTKAEIIAMNFTKGRNATHAGERVTFKITPKGNRYIIQSAALFYRPPGAPVAKRRSLIGTSSGAYATFIGSRDAVAGRWLYAYEATIEGQTYRWPGSGWYKFTLMPPPAVAPPPPPPPITTVPPVRTHPPALPPARPPVLPPGQTKRPPYANSGAAKRIADAQKNQSTRLALAKFFNDNSCCSKAHRAGKTCTHDCCKKAFAKGTVCERCNAGAAKRIADAKKSRSPRLALAKLFRPGSCCDKAHKAGRDCAHGCCETALKQNKVCRRCNEK